MSEVKSGPIHELKLEEDGSVIVAFAKTDSVDSDKDYTFPGAFPAGKSLPIGAYSHNSWPHRGGMLPGGKGVLSEEGGWAILKGQFFIDTTHGRDEYLTVKHMGDEQQWSYGFDVLLKDSPPPGVKARRGLKSLDVHEVCPVLLGAESTTHTVAIKELADDPDDGLEAEVIASLKDSLPAGETFAELSSRLLRDVPAFVDRAGAIHSIRLKEGRAISTARLELLNRHAAALGDALKEIQEMLTAVAPKDEDTAKMRRMRLEATLAVARSEAHALRIN